MFTSQSSQSLAAQRESPTDQSSLFNSKPEGKPFSKSCLSEQLSQQINCADTEEWENEFDTTRTVPEKINLEQSCQKNSPTLVAPRNTPTAEFSTLTPKVTLDTYTIARKMSQNSSKNNDKFASERHSPTAAKSSEKCNGQSDRIGNCNTNLSSRKRKSDADSTENAGDGHSAQSSFCYGL